MKTKPYRFLIIEDNQFNQLVLNDTLLDWNKNLIIDIAENGQIGVDKAKQNIYDLIFMDIQMPVMNGHEATQIIKTKLPEPFCNVPIVAVTAHALKTEEEFCLQNGMLAYITKPFDEKYLISTIESILNKKKPRNSDVKPISEEIKTKNVVNTNIIITTTKGNKERIEKMVNMFLKDTPDELKKLNDYYQQKNFTALRTQAHSFKPKFTYMGMPQLTEIAKQIEYNAAEENNIPETEALITLLTEQSELAYQELKKLLIG